VNVGRLLRLWVWYTTRAIDSRRRSWFGGGQFDWKNIGLFPDLRDLIYTFWFIYCVMAFLSYTYLVQGMWGLEFRVWGLGFMVWVEGFRVWGLGFMVWGLGLGV
jgi:hypothetical protein